MPDEDEPEPTLEQKLELYGVQYGEAADIAEACRVRLRRLAQEAAEQGASTPQIVALTGMTPQTVNYWLRQDRASHGSS